jgi:hypothetical protein
MSNPTLLYIVGRGHSGSTLLELLLNRNTNVAAMGELDLLSLQIYRDERTRWVGRCSCGARPKDCDIWGRVMNDIENEFDVDICSRPFSWKVSDVGTYEEKRYPGLVETMRFGYHRAIRSFFYTLDVEVPRPLNKIYKTWVSHRDFTASRYSVYAGVDVIVDASKDHLHMRDIDLYSTLPHKFIYLTRDVRGNAWSAIKGRGVSAKKEAKDWSKLNKRILNIINTIDRDKVMQVKYEELCRDPQSVLEQIYQFIGVDNTSVSSEAEFQKRHTIAGNKIRFKQIDKIKHDLGWMENLSSQDLSDIQQYAGDVANKLGYSLAGNDMRDG